MPSIKTSLLISFIVLGQACTSVKINQAIAKFMIADYSSALNSLETLLLTWNTRTDTGTPVLHFAVWDLTTGEKVYAGTALRGKVAWLSPTSLELYDYPGIIDDNNPLYKYKIDLITKTKTALREENKL